MYEGEVTGGWRKWHNYELHNLHSLSKVIKMIKVRRMKWMGHVGHTPKKRNAYYNLERKETSLVRYMEIVILGRTNCPFSFYFI
jgi:hypothetical protein